jgi:hypothetical protein
VSKSTVSALCGQLKHDFDRWQNRDLSDVDLLYLFCDGLYLRLRPEDPKAVAVVVTFQWRSLAAGNSWLRSWASSSLTNRGKSKVGVRGIFIAFKAARGNM